MSKPNRRELTALVRQILAQSLIHAVAKLWTVQDVLFHLQITKRTFYRNRGKWKFPKPDVREGSFIRWLPETVKLWEINYRGK